MGYWVRRPGRQSEMFSKINIICGVDFVEGIRATKTLTKDISISPITAQEVKRQYRGTTCAERLEI